MIVYEVIGIEHGYDYGDYFGSWLFDNRESAEQFLNEQKKYSGNDVWWLMFPKTVLQTAPELLWEITIYDDNRLLPQSRKYQDTYKIVEEINQVCDEVIEQALSSKVTKYIMFVKAQNFDNAMVQSIRLLNDYKDAKNEVTYL